MRARGRPFPSSVHHVLVGLTAAVTLLANPWTRASAAPAGRTGWVNTGPPGAVLADIAASPSDQARLYATSSSHLYRTDDGGYSWTSILSQSLWFEPNLAVSSQNPDVLYAANRKTVKKTVDGGQTWTSINNGLPSEPDVLHMAVDPTNDQVVYAAIWVYPGTLYKTIDGGAHWVSSSNGIPSGTGAGPLAIDPTSPQIVFAGTSGGVYKTVNGGASWTFSGNGLPAFRMPDAMAIDPADHQRLFATVEGDVYRSVDGGANWALSNSGMNGAPAYALAVSGALAGTVYSATAPGFPTAPYDPAGVFRSTDGGATWQRTSRVVGANVLVTNSGGVLYAIGDPLGVLTSSDGGVGWSQASGGMMEANVPAVAVDPTNARIAYASLGSLTGIFKTTDGGARWRLMGRGLNGSVVSLAVAPSNHQVVYAGVTNYGWYGYYSHVGVYRSVDGGATFRPANARIDDVQVNALAVDPADPKVVYAAGEYFCDECNSGGIWKSLDGGASWVRLGGGLSSVGYPAIAMSPSDPNVLVASASTYGTMYRTEDGGHTWVKGGSGLGFAILDDIAVDPVDPLTVYGVSGSFYISTTGGATWVQGGPQSPKSSFTVEADPVTAGSLCSGESSGFVDCSIDHGLTWTRLPQLNGAVPSLAIGPSQVLYAGTGSHGVAVFRQ
jgi:photosystem II stability/assembly factor-like uncharacterized protein